MTAGVTRPFRSLAPFLDVLEPYVPPALIGPDAWSALRTAAAGLPEPLVPCFGFECDLADTAPTADLAACWSVAARGPDALASLADPELSGFGRRWGDGLPIDDVWLEIDVRRGETRRASLFFAPRSETVETTLDILGGFLSGPHRATLRAVSGRLPAEARIFQVGVMLARPGRSVRLCLGYFDPDVALATLRALGVEAASLGAGLASLPLRQGVGVGLEVGENGLGPRVGVECAVERRCLRMTDEQEGMLAALVARGWVNGAKVDALRRWPRVLSAQDDWTRWPPSLDAERALTVDGRLSRLVLHMSHLKLSWADLTRGKTPGVKAYFGVTHVWQDLYR